MGIYALYKGEQMLSTGTIYEIAKELSVEVKTIKYYGTNAYKRKLEKRTRNARELIELDNE
ncbi:hypothetical protein [uncultured Clostridium sp.]|uniref:hypothetical protein n=1 Tax=uncultured Clostridium sp. TaxID=59620 RepID=UPI0025FF897D|nr:hypothetical protein [uncultured Clostridium sp.]